MPVLFNKMERGNPANPLDPRLWYPILKSTGLMKEREIAKLLSEETTLNPKEAEMAIFQLFKVVVRLLLDGHTVQLGPLGSFRLTARAHGVPTEAEVTSSLIRKLMVRFTESADMREAIAKATFLDIAALSNR
ncbi:MAG: HU family DNA-binding protein [Tannerella sp.]|jgi:predicted histone-like DNA-binding protein|nr:HU family DNA-binding protein [Tannerella sp.]